MGKYISIIAGFYLFFVSFFAWGFASAKLEIFPYRVVTEVLTYLQGRENFADIIRFDHQERRNAFNFSAFKVVDSNFTDDGFLLIARYSKNHSQTLVELFDISGDQVLHTWVPDLNAIFAMAPIHVSGDNTRISYRSQHPLLMDNGDLVISSGGGPLVRINICGKPVWAIDRYFHHSIELDDVGNLVVPTFSVVDDDGFQVNDNGFAIISPTGEVLSEHSLNKIMLDNGFQGIVYGVGTFEQDRYHLNDVQPLLGKPAAEAVLLSMRNISSVALYSTATGKIDWLKTGPWLNQHDINDLGDGRYSIFGNDVIRGPNKILSGRNEIYIYRPTDGQVETPFSTVLAQADVRTPEGGRLTILRNGDAFIEETERDRLLRVSQDQVRWEYVNGISPATSGAIHWSRYLKREDINISWLEDVSCE